MKTLWISCDPSLISLASQVLVFSQTNQKSSDNCNIYQTKWHLDTGLIYAEPNDVVVPFVCFDMWITVYVQAFI